MIYRIGDHSYRKADKVPAPYGNGPAPHGDHSSAGTDLERRHTCARDPAGTYTVSWTVRSGLQDRAYLIESGSASHRFTVTGRQSQTLTRSPGTNSYRLQLCSYEPESRA